MHYFYSAAAKPQRCQVTPYVVKVLDVVKIDSFFHFFQHITGLSAILYTNSFCPTPTLVSKWWRGGRRGAIAFFILLPELRPYGNVTYQIFYQSGYNWCVSISQNFAISNLGVVFTFQINSKPETKQFPRNRCFEWSCDVAQGLEFLS